MYPIKRYLHFDNIIDYNENIKNYVENPERIEKHSFFPFIKFVISFKRFISNDYLKRNPTQPTKLKEREILYASHIDGFIYKYYGEKLNEIYNAWVKNNFFDKCATAYRNNKSGKCNIEYAYEVIDFIVKCDDCYIMVGDYKNFFGSLDHQYLKDRIIEVLGGEELSKDYYKIFKSVTKYSYINKDDIENKLKIEGKSTRNIKRYFSNMDDFRNFKKQKDILKPNPNYSYGIPQGTAMSAVLANVYMINVDQQIQDLIKNNGGLYRRYSDDFIIVIPTKYNDQVKTDQDFKSMIEMIEDIISTSKLKLQEDKTELFKFSDKKISLLNSSKKNILDYLGFCFDGENVSVRQRSVYKFYRHAYQAVKIAKKRTRKKENKVLINKRKIYALYTDLGKFTNSKYKYKYKSKYRSNFISYIKRAQIVFENNKNINSLILQQISHRKKKIFDKCNAN